VAKDVTNLLGGRFCPQKKGGVLNSSTAVAFVLFLGLSTTMASAMSLSDLEPCRPAAERYCDRSAGMTWSNLLRCGATLAAHSFHINNSCRDVLRRYGQL
jgi:hypothetical protein